MSHHLRVLFGAGLGQRERRGNWVYYRVIQGALEGVRAALGGDVSDGRSLTVASMPAETTAGEMLHRAPHSGGEAR